MFPTLFRWLWYVSPYLQYVFTAVLFVTSGKKDQDDNFTVLYDIDL